MANWAGEISDRSVKVTSLSDAEEADWLAYALTRVSEYAWGAAVWLDTTSPVESSIATLIERLRSPDEERLAIEVEDAGCRHAGQWGHSDLKTQLSSRLPEMLSRLSRGQRVSVADELAADAAGRAEGVRTLPSGWDPESSDSRAWQMCQAPRFWDHERTASLPEGGAGWIDRVWRTEGSPAKRWGGRDRLVRLEQLAAACEMFGGHAVIDANPTHVHLVVPHDPTSSTHPEKSDVFKVLVHDGEWDEGRADPFAPLIVRKDRRGRVLQETKIEPEDDDEFERMLGKWTRLVSYTYFERDYEE